MERGSFRRPKQHASCWLLVLPCLAALLPMTHLAPCTVSRAGAQSVHAPTLTLGASSGFYESFQVSGLSGLGPVIPPFGGYDPAADARIGFQIGSLGFSLTAGQGSQRTLTSQSGTLVLPNGGTGTLFSGQMRPFVIGIVPVVGYAGPGGGYYTNPAGPLWDGLSTPAGPSDLQMRIARWRAEGSPLGPVAGRTEPVAASDDQRLVAPPSTAARGAPSVAAIRQAASEETARLDEEVDAWVEKAQAAEQQQQFNRAIHLYRRAAEKAWGQRRAQLRHKIRQLQQQQQHHHEQSRALDHLSLVVLCPRAGDS